MVVKKINKIKCKTKKSQVGGSGSRTTGSALKNKSSTRTKLKSGFLKYGKTALKLPAYAVRGTSALLGSAIGLGVKRAVVSGVRKIQTGTAKSNLLRQQRKMNVLLGLRDKNLWRTKTKEMVEAEAYTKAKQLENKIQSMRTTGTKDKDIKSAQEELKKLVTKHKFGTFNEKEGKITIAENAPKTLNELREEKMKKTTSQGRLAVMQRKLDLRQQQYEAAKIKSAQAKQALKSIASNSYTAAKKAVYDVSQMSVKKTLLLYTLATLGAPGATPLALLAMPIYDTMKAVGKDTPAIAKIGTQFRNLFRGRADLMDQASKYDEHVKKLDEGVETEVRNFASKREESLNKLNRILDQNMRSDPIQRYKQTQLETLEKKPNKDDTDKQNIELLKKVLNEFSQNQNVINEEIRNNYITRMQDVDNVMTKMKNLYSEIKNLKTEVLKEQDPERKKKLQSQLTQKQNDLIDAKNTHNKKVTEIRNYTETTLSKDQAAFFTDALEPSMRFRRMLDLSDEASERQRTIKERLVQEQKDDIKLLKEAAISSSGVAAALTAKQSTYLQGLYNPKSKIDLVNVDFNYLSEKYQKALQASHNDPALEIPVKYLKALLTAKIMSESYRDIALGLPPKSEEKNNSS